MMPEEILNRVKIIVSKVKRNILLLHYRPNFSAEVVTQKFGVTLLLR
jgi:hypothetical protein